MNDIREAIPVPYCESTFYNREEDDWRCFKFQFLGTEQVGFTLHGMDQRTQEWIEPILREQFKRVHDKAFEVGRDMVRYQIKEALRIA